MARTNDPHSATSQFFINAVDNPYLNFKEEKDSGWGYCVFGEMTDGEEVLDKISRVKTTLVDYHRDVPEEEIVIESITID